MDMEEWSLPDTSTLFCVNDPCHMKVVVSYLSRRVQYQVYSLKEGSQGSKKGSVPFKNDLEGTLGETKGIIMTTL